MRGPPTTPGPGIAGLKPEAAKDQEEVHDDATGPYVTLVVVVVAEDLDR